MTESSARELVWLVTGASSGLGRAIAEAVLRRGDKVIATARAQSFGRIRDLKSRGASILELDVTANTDDFHRIAKAAVDIYGRIDVLVNNAGYGFVGGLEETTSEETLHQFSTNLFGGLNLARAVLPSMREQKSGTIVWVGSLAGHKTLEALGLYCASKSAMRSISSALHIELSSISPALRSLCIEPGWFRTSAFENIIIRERPIPEYDGTTRTVEALNMYRGQEPGDPQKGANAVIDIVRGEGLAKGKPWPTKSILLGRDSYEMSRYEMEALMKETEVWKDLSVSTDFDQ